LANQTYPPVVIEGCRRGAAGMMDNLQVDDMAVGQPDCLDIDHDDPACKYGTNFFDAHGI